MKGEWGGRGRGWGRGRVKEKGNEEEGSKNNFYSFFQRGGKRDGRKRERGQRREGVEGWERGMKGNRKEMWGRGRKSFLHLFVMRDRQKFEGKKGWGRTGG